MNETLLLIGGEWVPASKNDRFFHRLNPVSGKPFTRAAAASVPDVEAAVRAAAEAFSAWAATGPGKRRDLLLRAAEVLVAHQSAFVASMIAETGATEGWAGFNVAFGASILREAAAMTTQVTGEIIPSDVPGNLAMAIRQPVGVCLGIAPWNAPVILGVRAIAMPVACGNTVIFKASESCPAVHS